MKTITVISDDKKVIQVSDYLENVLYKNISYDENEGAGRGEVIEFTNKSGQVVLKKTKVSETAGVKDYAQTYYIYDRLENLRYVLQTQGVHTILTANNWNLVQDEEFQKMWMFCYQYDGQKGAGFRLGAYGL